MRRGVTIAIVCSWLVMVGLLVRRQWPSPAASLPAEIVGAPAGDEWMAVYHKDQKIGYTHHTFVADGQGFIFSEESLLRLAVLQTPQTVRTRIHGHTSSDYSLRDVDFELRSGVGDLQVSGAVRDGALHLTLHTGKDTTEQVVPLNEKIYVPSTVRAFVATHPLRAGQQLEALVFDPTSLTNDHIRLTVEEKQPVPGAADGPPAWRVREEFRGMQTVAWLDAGGAVLREEGPMDMILVRENEQSALTHGWDTNTALDLVASAAVPVVHPIADARERTSLRVRVSGIPLQRVLSDDEQSRDGALVTIRHVRLADVQSYELPYRGEDHRDDLRATPFLQSDHPRVHALARQILAGETDAVRATISLNDWVYAYLRKVPTVSIPNALQVLDMGEGDCNEHAVLFAALARAVGLPTRTLAGVVYLNGAFYYHAWCDVWFGRWVSVDPALHQFPADATHLKFVAGDAQDQLAMLEIIGRLGVDIVDETDARTAAH